MNVLSISIMLTTLSLATALSNEAPNQEAVIEYEAGKHDYENSPIAEPGTPQWVDRTHALRKAVGHFLKSYELYRHSKTALFIAFIYGQLSQKNEAKDYAEIAINGHPALTRDDADTASAIKKWATPSTVTSSDVTFYGGDVPPKSVQAPKGDIR
jgi:hypothetical protein